FQGHSFWLQDYVAAGPFKETEYVPGDHIDTAAFAGYALGRPKIDKIRIVFIGDPQAGVAQLLSGNVHFSDSFVINPTDGINLEQQWADTKAGEILWSPTDPREALVQWRPEYALPVGIRDQRVRKALAYGFDNQGAIDGLNFGKGILTNTSTVPGIAGFDQIDKVIEHYRYDPRMVAQLMTDAGYAKGTDGFFADSTGKRFEVDIWSSSGDKNIQEATFFADGLRRAGMFANQQVFSLQQLNDGMARATVPGLSIRGGNNYTYYLTSDIAGPVNKWSSNNRSGYSNPEYDRFYDEWTNTLDSAKRIQALANLERVFNQDVGAIMMYFQDTPTARVAALKGPAAVDHQGSGGNGASVLRISTWTWEP
ncbi:MAG TPA: ABC transporter substrate-binding protein, partial [Chloroflexota bacterium]